MYILKKKRKEGFSSTSISSGLCRRWDSSVGIVTSMGWMTEELRFNSRQGSEMFLPFKTSILTMGSIQGWP